MRSKLLLIILVFTMTAAATTRIYVKEGKEMVQIKTLEKSKVNIVSLYFPSDNGSWTDLIISGFEKRLNNTGLDVESTHISYKFTMADQHVLNRIKKLGADYVFLPDDHLYLRFAKKIEAMGTKVIFITFYSKKESIYSSANVAGVICDAPVVELLENSEKIISKKIDSIAVVGGPFGVEISQRIKEKIGNRVNLTIKITESWSEYSNAIKNSTTTAIWPLAPFGVKNSDGKPPQDHQVETLLSSLRKFTFGYGRIEKRSATASMNIDPKTLGSNAAKILFDHLTEARPLKNMDFLVYDFRISDASLSKLNLKIPEKLLGFLVK